MLGIQNITKSYGAETVLKNVSFVLNPGERIGLVGPNGCGKSTLLRIITGEESQDSGAVHLGPGTRLGYLPQGLAPDTDGSVFEAVRKGFPDWDETRREVERISQQLAGAGPGEEGDALLSRYGEALSRFESLGGYERERGVGTILAGLGFPEDRIHDPFRQLSGGQRTRAVLASVLFSQPDYLLLDEPTNHLDIEALEWLESFLKTFPGGILVVSHDRIFLDTVVSRVAAFDPEKHSVTLYSGGYRDYAREAARELEKTWQAWQEQQVEIKRMRQDIHKTKMHAQGVELTTTSRQPNLRRYAKKVAKKAKSREKKLDRYLASDEMVEKPKRGWQLNLSFDEMERSGNRVCEMSGLGHQYGNGPWLFQDLNKTVLLGERIALIGPNGSGKSTLLKILAGQTSPAAGKFAMGTGVRIGYMPQEQETLDTGQTPSQVIQNARSMSETEARNFLHNFLIAGDAAVQPLGFLSFGERARLVLARLVVQGANFLILDEPLNHLDIPSRERFEAALDAFPGTVLATAHDRAFIARYPEKIWDLKDGLLLEI